MGGCKGTAHALCCNWLTTSAAFTAKVAAWPTTQAGGDGRRRPHLALREYKSECRWNWSEISSPRRQWAFPLLWIRRTALSRKSFYCKKRSGHILKKWDRWLQGWRNPGTHEPGPHFFWGVWPPLLNFEFCLNRFRQHN